MKEALTEKRYSPLDFIFVGVLFLLSGTILYLLGIPSTMSVTGITLILAGVVFTLGRLIRGETK